MYTCPPWRDRPAQGVQCLLARWPEFAAALSADAGTDAGLHPEGTVVAATGSGDRAELTALES